MPTPKKIQTVEEIQSKLNEASCVVLTDFRGLNVAQATALRRRLTEAGVEYKVYKNTLIKIAADNVGIEGLDSYLQGPTALAFSTEDPIAPAKILADFARETKILKVKAGVLDGQIIDKDRVAELAALPPKEVILGKVVGAMQGPIFGLVNVLAGPTRKLVWALDAIRQQKEEAGGDPQTVQAQ
ncbi:MAG: 50S ribosomal protein L10 [Bacillota bacterium]|nr:50S ribosomal protein L10 [Bacillota bacterium]HOK70181.1 50S ribosomal protein L10 [Bacillota bacterium]HOL51364.1 50S ribosomal protein L10 [Bacillota bacterium]HOO31362.1 50S ribosomal protein L10 [Bacillota bacterium]HPQ02989.1 50S ribosomal protein L10 [Bacillota bacterium]